MVAQIVSNNWPKSRSYNERDHTLNKATIQYNT